MIIHINLISHQLLPNVIGSFSNPDKEMKIILVLGDNKLKEKAVLLEDFYRKKGVTHIETINCQTSTDHAKIFVRAEALFEQLRFEYPNAMIAVNATGGTKPMSIAFTQVFDKLTEKSMVFYTDTIEKQNTILTNPHQNKFPPLPYVSVLNVDDYLYLNQFNVNSEINKHCREHDNIIDRRPVTDFLLGLCKRETNLISLLNGLAGQTNFSSNNKFKPVVERVPQFNSMVSCYQHFERANLVTFNEAEATITFSSEEAARYIGGAWFEEFAYLAAFDSGIDYVSTSVDGHWLDKNNTESSVSNELDLVLVHNNQMMIVECKTSNWREAGKGQDVTLKLESLMRNLGGSHAKGILLSVFELPEHTHDRVKNLNNLTPLSGGAIHGLVNQLKDWKSKVS
ncbi:Card1-like endonuclease domain-containing protein [Colwellia sp. 12G3]|uniref:Card1-like endonuclease domain-containing protein n=1 Tax=Colwellia sp. 12G3 TaxID=2058299 RepID=UPI0012FF1F90|nr:DUF1887 family CARF protein [Colwellia sp. 12G3]